MIDRKTKQKVEQALQRQPAVALIGPRQVGKTTLALEIAKQGASVYLDLESYEDRQKLQDPILFFNQHKEALVVLDEIHRMPELFQTLRGVIDQRRRSGKRFGCFLILGSASIDLLKQSGETLAGRIGYIEMTPLNVLEVEKDLITDLWVRGGFPDSFLAPTEKDSFLIRRDFIKTYLEREVAQFTSRVPAETLERLWMMLAHSQGTMINVSRFASNLSVASKTLNSYIDLLADLLLVRRLKPFHANIGKRLIKTPKVYIRDSGLMHALLSIGDISSLLGNPLVGASWEGFVIENILSVLPFNIIPSFYRTSAGAEVDLLLEFADGKKWAIEIKSGLSFKVSRGFYSALETLKPQRSFVVYGGSDLYPISETIEAVSLTHIMQRVQTRDQL